MSWRHLLWDMGGTMIDTYPAVDRLYADLCARHGEPVDFDEIVRLTRGGIAEAGTSLARRLGIPSEAFADAYAALKRSWRDAPPPVMEGTRDLLAEAHRRRGLNIVVTHRDRDSATDLLHAHGLTVDDLICAPDGHPRKPDPAMHRLAVERHGLDPADCLAVGDRAIDAEAAEAAGVPWAMLVTPGIAVERTGGVRVEKLAELGELS